MEDVVVSDPFQGVDPSIIIAQLLLVPPQDCINGKAFWKSYKGKWEDLSSDQKNKTVIFFETNITNEVRQRILENARQISLAENVAESNRQAMTTKHDKARLLHLRVDVNAQADWTAALTEKSRAQLDTDDPSADPWNRKALI